MMEPVKMDGILGESLVTIAEARNVFPGGRRSEGCLERWIKKGIDGVKLEIGWVGRKRFTSREAIRRFLAATMNREPGAPIVAEPMVPTLPIRTPEETERQLSEIFAPKKRGPKSTNQKGAEE